MSSFLCLVPGFCDLLHLGLVCSHRHAWQTFLSQGHLGKPSLLAYQFGWMFSHNFSIGNFSMLSPLRWMGTSGTTSREIWFGFSFCLPTVLDSYFALLIQWTSWQCPPVCLAGGLVVLRSTFLGPISSNFYCVFYGSLLRRFGFRGFALVISQCFCCGKLSRLVCLSVCRAVGLAVRWCSG